MRSIVTILIFVSTFIMCNEASAKSRWRLFPNLRSEKMLNQKIVVRTQNLIECLLRVAL